MKVVIRYHEEESASSSARNTPTYKLQERVHTATMDLSLTATLDVPDINYADGRNYSFGVLAQEVIGPPYLESVRPRRKLPPTQLVSLSGTLTNASKDTNHTIQGHSGEGRGPDEDCTETWQKRGTGQPTRADSFNLSVDIRGERAMVSIDSNHFPVTAEHARSCGNVSREQEPARTDLKGGIVIAHPIQMASIYVIQGMVPPGCSPQVKRQGSSCSGTVKCTETKPDGTHSSKDLSFELSL